jgi:hypothetical protein
MIAGWVEHRIEQVVVGARRRARVRGLDEQVQIERLKGAQNQAHLFARLPLLHLDQPLATDTSASRKLALIEAEGLAPVSNDES